MVRKLNFKGIDIRIEYEKGETKPSGSPFSWYAESGWTVYADYGYIEGTLASDGEEIDVYVGEDHDSEEVYILTLLTYQGADDNPVIDEWKVLLGFSSYEEAKDFALVQYGDYKSGIIYKSYLRDIDLLSELTNISKRKEMLYMQESEKEDILLPAFEEVGQYGGTPGRENIITVNT